MVAEYQGGQAARYRAEYFHQDHLGNTRLVFSDFNQNGLIELTEEDPTTQINELEITQAGAQRRSSTRRVGKAHYYPFGMGHLGPCLVRRSFPLSLSTTAGGERRRGMKLLRRPKRSEGPVPEGAGRISICIMGRSSMGIMRLI